MKRIIAAVLLALSYGVAGATDYNSGQCPAGFSDCHFSSNAINGGFVDTWTFTLGNWPEYYGTYVYQSSKSIKASGGHGCYGRYSCYTINIESASIDGVPLVFVGNYTWQLAVDLAPGAHTLSVTGSGGGGASAHWTADVQGIVYTVE